MAEYPVTVQDFSRLRDLCIRYLREPSNITADPVTGALSFWFEPALTTDEETRFARLQRIADSHIDFTDDEWAALIPTLVEIRGYRQRSGAEWSAMTAAQRDADLIQWCRDLTDVLRAAVRD